MAQTDVLNNTIFETTFQPFGLSAYSRNQKISDFVGRKEEMHQFREHVLTIMRTKTSLAVRLDGPAGVGKSTLFNFVKETIEKEKRDELRAAYYLNEEVDILSTYFQLVDQVSGFSQLWRPILEGLKAEIEEETKFDIGFIEYIVVKFIYKLFQFDPKTISSIIWSDSLPPKELKYITFQDLLEPIYDHLNPDTLVIKLQNYYDQHKRRLRRETKITIDNTEYRLYRRDTELIKNLLRVLNEDDEYLLQILNVNPSLFSSDDELIKFYNTLNRLYSVSTEKQLIMVIGIDEIAKIDYLDEESRNQYYQTLGNLLVRLRNTLDSTLFVFISTTDDWAQFDMVINKQTDLRSQLLPILKTMPLKPLSIEEAIEVFKNRMDRFWANYPSQKDSVVRYYPFNEFFFRYVYQYNKRDLRHSIIQLEDIWRYFRYNRSIPRLTHEFDVLRFVRNLDRKLFTGINFFPFEWDIIDDYFDQSQFSKNNTSRSNAIEGGLEMAWQCYRQRDLSQITAVKNNPLVRIGETKRRPDVIVEIAGDLGNDYLRRVEFQVKAYLNQKVSSKVIQSSIELFNSGYTDMIYFVVTGEGFDSEAEYLVEQLRTTYPNRIRNPVLRRDQELMLKFLALYDSIVGRPMGSNQEIDEKVAENALRVLLGQSPELFISNLKLMSTRGFDPTYIEEYEEAATTPTSLTDFMDDTSSEIEKKDELPVEVPYQNTVIPWLQAYPYLDPYKFETVALAQYLKGREGGRYEGQFTKPTVTKNVIKRDAKLDSNNFNNLVDELSDKGLLKKVKSSFVLTNIGQEWLEEIVKSDYQTH